MKPATLAPAVRAYITRVYLSEGRAAKVSELAAHFRTSARRIHEAALLSHPDLVLTEVHWQQEDPHYGTFAPSRNRVAPAYEPSKRHIAALLVSAMLRVAA